MTQPTDVSCISLMGLQEGKGKILPTVVDFVVDGASGDLQLEYEWAMIAKEIFELFKRKQKDYGPHNIGLGGDSAILTRITDKFMRLHTLYKDGTNWEEVKPQNESLDDTWIDLADYAVIALMYRRGHWPKSNLKEVLAIPTLVCGDCGTKLLYENKGSCHECGCDGPKEVLGDKV